MTREEAIAVLEESKRQNEIMKDNPSTFWASHQMADGVKNAERRIAALDLALSALRPVSREQVEKVWRGEWRLNEEESKKHVEPIYVCTRCENFEAWGNTEKTNFCGYCGAPMTDEAVDIIMRRLETLYETT